MEAKAVPKFGSFKPKVRSNSKETEHPKEHANEERIEKHSHHSEGYRRHGDRESQQPERRHRHDNQERSRQAQRKPQKSPDPPRSLAADEFEESSHFIIDKRGDSKNIVYGSLHRYSVPAYHRTGYGRVIGLSSHVRIDRDASDEKKISFVTSSHRGQAHQKLSRVLSSKYGKSSETQLRFVTAQPARTGDDYDDNFIEIRPSRKRKRGADSDDDHGTSVDYRSIEGKAKASEALSDDDLEMVSDDNPNDDQGLSARQESAVLSKEAKNDPRNLERWLALADHQSKLVRPGVDVSSLTSSERRTLADLKMSIYNESSKHISKGHPSREHLISAMIDEGCLIWDRAKLASKWIEALVECPTSIVLLTKHLDYVQDSHGTFRYEHCKKAYIDCLNILQIACEKASEVSRTEVNKAQFYVLLRLTAFIREAGYEELAIAIWQALIELHVFAPPMLSAASSSERLASLESFWESEVPRVGEKNGLGWCKHHETSDGAQRESQQPVEHETNVSQPLLGFATAEESFSCAFLLPASTYDDDAVADPFRCVMFSDVADIIKPLSANIPPLGIVESFMHFMGLPPISLCSDAFDTYYFKSDTHLATVSYSDSSPENSPSNVLTIPCRRETTLGLFEDAFNVFKDVLQQKTVPEQWIRFIDRVLGSILEVESNNENLAEYYIAFKAHLLPAETPKTAKRIMKRQSSSLRLYNAYALAEVCMAHNGKAMEIWSAALSMRSGVGVEKQDDVIHLWHSRLLTQVRHGDDQGGLPLLLASTDDANGDSNEKPGSDTVFHTRQLRALRSLEATFDRTHLAGKVEQAVLCADLLAWLAYSTTDYNIDRPLRIYSKYSSRLSHEKSSLFLEQLHQCKARLLKIHIEQRRPHKPSLLQQELESSSKLFPSNSVLLKLHSDMAAQDRIRMLVREQKTIGLGTSPNVVQWSFKVAEEIRRSTHETSGSTSNTVRAAFSKALLQSDSTVSHSPALWNAWLHYEYRTAGSSHDSKAMQRADRVFLDGLRYLPWLKSWVIHGLKLFGDGTLSRNELRQVYEILNERGLRIRVDIEDLL